MENVITTALEIGYRHFDVGFIYNNEDIVGRSLKKWFEKGNKREDVFITSKVSWDSWNILYNIPSIYNYCKNILQDL